MRAHSPDEFVQLPAAALALLVERCGALGEAGIAALREAGRVAGSRVFDTLGERPESLSVASFWDALDRRLRELKLGSLDVDGVDEGLIAVRWERLGGGGSAPRPATRPREGEGVARPAAAVGTDADRTGEGAHSAPWMTAYTADSGTGGGGQAQRRIGCHFTTGLLGGVLSRAANRPIAVLEVHCGIAGPDPCWFLVGSEGRLTSVHQRLSSGASLSAALDR